ncbi:hypothetical protein Btru_073088 [Bulinus truncatus]|nr:hypothetical protein Btru_073088 [Bulinus truncatus]
MFQDNQRAHNQLDAVEISCQAQHSTKRESSMGNCQMKISDIKTPTICHKKTGRLGSGGSNQLAASQISGAVTQLVVVWINLNDVMEWLTVKTKAMKPTAQLVRNLPGGVPMVSVFPHCRDVVAMRNVLTSVTRRTAPSVTKTIINAIITNASQGASGVTDTMTVMTTAMKKIAWQCRTNQCIDARFRCDGFKDCLDNSDELNCRECYVGYFWTCRSGQCVNSNYKCNSRVDCRDKSDEESCISCSFSEWRCSSDQCIDKLDRCNGHSQCDDDSDEEHCLPCSSGYFKCTNGQCVSNDDRCNGILDCLDGGDEESCPECSRDSWKCHNSTCIPVVKRCNGIKDCTDGSDEMNCSITSSYKDTIAISTSLTLIVGLVLVMLIWKMKSKDYDEPDQCSGHYDVPDESNGRCSIPAESDGHYNLPAESDGHYNLTTESDGHYNLTTESDGHYNVTTGSDGHYNLTTESDGHYNLPAESDGHYNLTTESDGHYNVTTGSDGHYNLTTESDGHYNLPAESDGHYNLTTESDGHYNLTTESDGHYNLTTESDGHYNVPDESDEHYNEIFCSGMFQDNQKAHNQLDAVEISCQAQHSTKRESSMGNCQMRISDIKTPTICHKKTGRLGSGYITPVDSPYNVDQF